MPSAQAGGEKEGVFREHQAGDDAGALKPRAESRASSALQLDDGADQDDRQADRAQHQAQRAEGLEGGEVSVLHLQIACEHRGRGADGGAEVAQLVGERAAEFFAVGGIGGIRFRQQDVEAGLARIHFLEFVCAHVEPALEDAAGERGGEAQAMRRAGGVGDLDGLAHVQMEDVLGSAVVGEDGDVARAVRLVEERPGIFFAGRRGGEVNRPAAGGGGTARIVGLIARMRLRQLTSWPGCSCNGMNSVRDQRGSSGDRKPRSFRPARVAGLAGSGMSDSISRLNPPAPERLSAVSVGAA